MASLAGSGLSLERLPIVTTKWKDWKERHPSTKVLSLETGHKRDYGEGVAYQDYFSHDKLMFPVPFESPDLRNKQEVVATMGSLSRLSPEPARVTSYSGYTSTVRHAPTPRESWPGTNSSMIPSGKST